MENNELDENKKEYILNYALGGGLVNRLFKPASNETRDLEDGYISYNPSTDTGEETAVTNGDGNFFILLGNHFEALQNCKTYDDCSKVFKELIKNGEEVSVWSNYK